MDTLRHTPYYTHPDIRIYELNKRLQQRTEESDNLWWDSFVAEFFEDDATLTLTFCFEDGPKRYTIGRTLIPRYFRSIFEAGVTELYYHVVQPKETYQNSTITLDCENTTMVTHHIKPLFTQVLTEGRLILEFTFDDLMRIRNWHFAIHQYREMVSKSVINGVQDSTMLEQLSKNITRQGMTNVTLNYLKVCVVLEPMQELMTRHKMYNMNPRDCLKSTLFQRWQRMYAPQQDFNQELMWQPSAPGPGFDDGDPGVPYGRKVSDSKTKTPRAPRTKRKRKSSATPTSTTPTSAPNSKSTNKKSPSSSMSLATQDVMVVGEPSLMGGEFGDEDERLITRLGCDQLTSGSPLHLPLPRLENAQYDASNGVGDDEEFGQSPMTSNSPSLPSWSSESRKQAQEDNAGD